VPLSIFIFWFCKLRCFEWALSRIVPLEQARKSISEERAISSLVQEVRTVLLRALDYNLFASFLGQTCHRIAYLSFSRIISKRFDSLVM